MDVRALALEVAMRLNLDVDDQVTSRPPNASVSFFRYTKIDPVINAFWDVDSFLNL